MVYVRLGEWLIKESNRTAWIYKDGICYARIPFKKHKKVRELRDLLENFLIIIGAFYE